MSNPNISQQIITAIKYIKSDFPPQYTKWKPLHQGEKLFQTHLNVIEYMFTKDVYAKLRGKIWDELLIKLRFFSINETYLMNFQAFLLQRFVKFIIKQLKIIYNLGQVYDAMNDGKISHVTLRREVQQRYSLLSQCLINVLKFCFKHNKMNRSEDEISSSSSFKNQLVRMEQKHKVDIVSREFIHSITNILQQKMQQITTYKILDIQKIYPSFFSTLTDGLLTFTNGGSKFIESIGRLIVMLVDENSGNVWVERKVMTNNDTIDGNNDDKDVININNNNNGYQQQKMKQLNDQIIKAMRRNVGLNNNNIKDQTKQSRNEDKQNRQKQQQQQEKTFQQISKHRLLVFLLALLQQCGYIINLNKEKQQQQQDICFNYSNNNTDTIINISNNRRQKYKAFVNSLLSVVVGGCFIINGNNNESHRYQAVADRLQQKDNDILFCLVLLAIQFTDYQRQEQLQSKQSSSPCLNRQFLCILRNPSSLSLSINDNLTIQSTIQPIRHKLHNIFISKFKLLVNKNKTISTQKTILLKQLNQLISYVDFFNVQCNNNNDQFINIICLKLKLLFSPNEQDMNRPLIIAIDDNNRLQATTIGQAVPLTPLQPYHSSTTYPITLTAMKQSLKFQQHRHILDEIRLFQWFQHQQTNLKLFKQLLTKFDLNSKLIMLQYFLEQLIKIKIAHYDNFYALQMSLSKFYQVLILQFMIDTLLYTQKQQYKGVLDIQLYNNNKQLYNKSILQKLKMLYSLIVSNIDMKKLLISNKEQQLLIFFSLRIMYNINSFFYQIKLDQSENTNTNINVNSNSNSNSSKISLLHSRMIIAENLILYLSHHTYLLQLLLTTYFIEFSAPNTIAQTLKPLQSTLIHRNAGSTQSTNKQCNLEFIKNLIKLCRLKPKQAQQLAQIYLSKDFVTNSQANSVISLLFPSLTPQTMRKCLLSIRNWPIIFLYKQNIELLSNQPLMQQPKQSLFHGNDNDNVTVSNALGVIVLQLGDKWIIELEFKNPKKQILIDAMINLIGVNDKMVFWKRFFFENVLRKLIRILKQIEGFVSQNDNNKSNSKDDNNKSNSKDHHHHPQQQKSRRILLYQRLHNKIYQLLSLISVQHYKYSTQINSQIRGNLQQLKQIVQKQYNHLKRQCFVHQRYQYLDRYKLCNALLEKVEEGLKYQQQEYQGEVSKRHEEKEE